MNEHYITNRRELISALEEVKNNQTDIEPDDYKYVMYLRKSTDDKDKQTRSLGDQFTECSEFADENGLKVAKVVRESVSAKSPDIRPKFREMLNDIKTGKYQAVLAWHPDRLARNMQDAGEIITLLDEGIIRNMKFRSFNFDNSSSGKMHLGITFVLSKQYSDHLSDSVLRGNKHSSYDGKNAGTAPHGYYNDGQQYLRADGDNYIIIKKAFQMRLAGSTMDAIAKYAVSNGYSKRRKDGSTYNPKLNKQTVKKIMANPVYTGVLWRGKKNPVDLTDFFAFQPMVTVDEFMAINNLTEKGFTELSNKYFKQEKVKANLLRGCVICVECGQSMTCSLRAKQLLAGKTNYYHFRCDTLGCSVYGKSTRAKVLIDYARTDLEQKPFSSKKAYLSYSKEMKRVSEANGIEANAEMRSLQAKYKNTIERHEKTKALLLDGDIELQEIFKNDLVAHKKKQKELVEQIRLAQEKIDKNKGSVHTYEKFLELMETIPKNLDYRKGMDELNYILRKVFLNFYIEDKKVVKTTLNSPFDKLETIKVSNGAR